MTVLWVIDQKGRTEVWFTAAATKDTGTMMIMPGRAYVKPVVWDCHAHIISKIQNGLVKKKKPRKQTNLYNLIGLLILIKEHQFHSFTALGTSYFDTSWIISYQNTKEMLKEVGAMYGYDIPATTCCLQDIEREKEMFKILSEIKKIHGGKTFQ